MASRMSRICEEARAAGKPAAAGHPHAPCTGCEGCACHHIRPPVRHIRNVFAEARDRVRRENTRGVPAQGTRQTAQQSTTEED